MSIVVNGPDPIDSFLRKPYSARTYRPESNTVSDDTKVIDSFAVSECGTNGHGSLHDSVGEGEVNLGVPIVLLVTAAQDGAAAYITKKKGLVNLLDS